MVYTKEAKSSEVISEGGEDVLKINYESFTYTPSIEDNAIVMMDAIDQLSENPSIARITFSQRRNYNYSYEQTKMLVEISNIYNYFVKSKRATSMQSLGLPNDPPELLGQRLAAIQYLMLNLLKQDPLGAYAELKRISRRESLAIKDESKKASSLIYSKLIEDILLQLEKTSLIQQSKEYLAGYIPGDREVYRLLFHPTITPDFMFTKIQASPPVNGEQLEIYKLNSNTEVSLFKTQDDIKTLYHINPPEFKISEDKFEIIDLAKKVLSEHQPRAEEFVDPEKMRSTFTNIGKDLIRELAEQKGLMLSPEDISNMAEILVRHTIGFGIVELLLEDERIQDITINSPMGQVPIFVLHQDYNECVTNIIPTTADFESWATKFRLISGRPLDEANPILDTEIILPTARSRLSVIGKPLNPFGYGMSFRRHRDDPWTLPLFIKNGMISPLGAGLLSFTIDGSRTHLIAGTRSSGKCLEGDEKIQLSNGELIKIKDLVEQSLHDDGYAECEDGYYAFINNKKIISLDENLKLKEKEITCVWKRSAPKFLYKIQLKSGKIITTTPEHPILSMNSTYFGYLHSSEIKKGYRIATVRSLKINSENNIEINFDLNDYIKRTNAKSIRLPTKITPKLLEFIGYILADGHIFNGGIHFINQDAKLRARFKEILLSEFGLNCKEKIGSRNGNPFIIVHSKMIANYLNLIFKIPIGKKAGIIQLPNIILGLDKDYLIFLLRAMFDCDGYAAKDHREIEYSSKSEEIIDQLQLILQRFSIISHKKSKIINDDTYFSLFINGNSYNLFSKNIGFNHTNKNLKVNYFIDQHFLETTNIDALPYGNTILKELRSRLRISPLEVRSNTGKDYWAYENYAYNVSHNWFKKLIPFYEKRFLELKKLDLTQLYNLYSILLNPEIIVKDLKSLSKDLNISQNDLVRFTNNPIKNTFERENIQFLDSLFSLQNILEPINQELYSMFNPDTTKLSYFLKDTNLSYAKLARMTNYSESSIKHYSNKSIFKTNPKISKYLKYFYEIELNETKNKLIPISQSFSSRVSLMKGINLEFCFNQLFLLKEKLNINLEEFDLNISSTSNFFNEIYKRKKLDNVFNIVKKILEVYESATSKEVEELIKLSKNLCSEDLFWDEVIAIETIQPKYEWVYDLTIEPSHNFVANGIIAHNTSFLSALLLEIQRKYRILTIEDSVTADCEILIRENNNIKKVKIGSLIDKQIEDNWKWYNLSEHEISGNPQNIEVLSMNKEGKITYSRISKFIRHKVEKKVYFVRTSTGRTIKVTGDHSLFTLNDNAEISEIKTSELKEGNYISTPRKIVNSNLGIKSFNLLNYISLFSKLYLRGGNLKEFLLKHREEIIEFGKDHDYKICQINKWFRTGIIPGKILSDLDAIDYELSELKDLEWKYNKNSCWLPIEINLDENLLTLIGLWIADGCYDKNSIILSVGTKEEREIVYSVGSKYNLTPKLHSDNFSLMLNSGSLKFFFREVLNLKGNAYTKRIPSWCFNLSNSQLGLILKGLFSGDGHVSNKEIMLSLCSKKLLEDVQTILLFYGVILRIGVCDKDKTFESRISVIKDFKLFKENIGILQDCKQNALNKLCEKVSTHDTSDIIPFSLEFKKEIKSLSKEFNSKDYINSNCNIGYNQLSKVCSLVKNTESVYLKLKLLLESDLYWDKVVEINEIEGFSDNVYDLSVPENESFVCNNIVAHNTLELPSESMRKFGYNIQPLKVRSALVKGGSEIPADEGIRTSLRLGDSALIVGEIRSSIRGNEKVFIVDKGKTERVAIKELEGRDISEMYVPTMDIDLKFKLKKVIAFVKHPPREKLLEVTTKTGRKITVTPDHSLFTHKDFRIIPIECKDLTLKSKIVIPEKIPCGYNNISKINLLELLEDNDCRLEGYEEDLKQIIPKVGWKKASEIANNSDDIYMYLRKGIQHSNIPIGKFKQLAKEANHGYAVSSFQIKKGTSKTLNAEIEISSDLCRFLGYYASEGYTQKEKFTVVFSNGNSTIVEDIIYLSKNLFNVNPFVRETKGLGISTQITLNNKVLGILLNKLGCGRIATEKRVPSFIFGLSEDKICEFLKGYFDGDGCQLVSDSSGNKISASTVSRELADDIVHLLFCLGIVARIEKGNVSDIGKHESYNVVFKQRNYVKIFLEKVGFKKYTKTILEKQTSHSQFNTVDYNLKILEEHVKIKRAYRHLRRYNSCGKDYLKRVVEDAEWSSDRIKSFVNGEFYLDEVKEIKEIKLNEKEPVYDLSVEPCQNFIGGFGGIMLHNTEASALYEAMRIGASANVVAGTIHGDSPYGVFDRVVNDLKVPRTSFKATDLIIMCNPIRSADGMKKVRRVTSITEVRKEWEEDPLKERGFVDLMKYNAKTDMLEPTPELINGESDILKSIGANVKEWVGNWDAIWDNILLRGELKKMLVDYSARVKMPKLLEAEFSLRCNDQFYRITEQTQSEVGSVDIKRIKSEWEEWLKREIKKKQI